MTNLRAEGLEHSSHLVGDVMADLLFKYRHRFNPRLICDALELSNHYVVATIHRAANTDNAEQLGRLINAMADLDVPVVLVAHPRLANAARRWEVPLAQGLVRPIQPLDYSSMLSLLVGSRGLITDSGGLQKEAFLLGVPCTTLRTESEWPETLAGGMNVLAPRGENLQAIVTRVVSPPTSQPYGDGHAARRIVDLLFASA